MKSTTYPLMLSMALCFVVSLSQRASASGALPEASNVSDRSYRQDTDISVFPNPTKDVITISNIVDHGVREIEIFDLVGEKTKVTYTSGLRDTIEIDLSNLRNGVYFIRFYNKKGKAIEMLKISKI